MKTVSKIAMAVTASAGLAAAMPAVAAETAPAQGHVISHAGDTPSGVGAHTTFTGQVRHDSLAVRMRTVTRPCRS